MWTGLILWGWAWVSIYLIHPDSPLTWVPAFGVVVMANLHGWCIHPAVEQGGGSTFDFDHAF
jgi:hypothetical protein